MKTKKILSVTLSLLGAVALSSLSVIPAWAADPVRLAGSDRAITAINIARHAFPNGAKTVYLARQDVLVDALAAGQLTDGPTILVPSTGVPSDYVNKLMLDFNPTSVIALGGTKAISDSFVVEVSKRSKAEETKPLRLAGQNRVQTAELIAKRAFPNGSKRIYLANANGSDGQGSADAVAAGALSDGALLLVDPANTFSTAATIKSLGATEIVALGGPAVLSDQTVSQLASGLKASRIAGQNRYETAAKIALHAFGQGASRVYLARGDVFADAVAGGALTDGPVLLVPTNNSPLVKYAWDATRSLKPSQVLALGSQAAVSDPVFLDVARVANGHEPQYNLTAVAPAPKPATNTSPATKPAPSSNPTTTPAPTTTPTTAPSTNPGTPTPSVDPKTITVPTEFASYGSSIVSLANAKQSSVLYSQSGQLADCAKVVAATLSSTVTSIDQAAGWLDNCNVNSKVAGNLWVTSSIASFSADAMAQSLVSYHTGKPATKAGLVAYPGKDGKAVIIVVYYGK